MKMIIFIVMAVCLLVQLWTGEALGADELVKRSDRPGQYWLSIFIQGGGVLLSILLSIVKEG